MKSQIKKVCVVTGTRAEYGLLKNVIKEINKSRILKLQTIVTGMHLSPEFGLTYKEIEKDGFDIDKKIDMLISSDRPVALTKSIAIGMSGFADALQDLKPDLLLVLGDRFEILSACIAAMVARIPIAHLHGGESTEGLIDESIRHSITKMSHLHFVSMKEYKNRVVQLGENPKNIFLVGALGVDSIKNTKFLSKKELEDAINFKFYKKNLLVTFHPVTLENSSSEKQMKNLLSALIELKDTGIIFTMPNADTDGRIIIDLINDFVLQNPNSKVYSSLGQLNYFSCMNYIDGVIGNSSSGLIEAPSFKIGTVNIGDRQKGRFKSKSVIDCKPIKSSILNGIKKLYSPNFQKVLNNVTNLYGSGESSSKIVKIIEKKDISNLLKKEFYNLGAK